ncbi:MAG: DUF2752 domain-containing protein [Spirochaetes bacterium]|nr:DUF2752 domain-containing protein [Spirochaetota bacterium]
MRTNIITISKIERAIGLSIIVGLLLLVYFVPNWFLLQNVCIFKMITHFDCPLCGMTESLHHAVKGEFDNSINKHPLGIPTIIALIAGAVQIAKRKIYALFLNFIGLFFGAALLACWLLRIVL